MAKRPFRLATLLRLREHVRDQRRAELAEAFRAEELLDEQQQTVGRELGWLREQCRSAAGPGALNVDRLVEAQRYEVALRGRQSRLVAQRQTLSAEVDRRREALLAADRDVRLLEKLRERQAQRQRDQENRCETNQLDEVAGQRAAREPLR